MPCSIILSQMYYSSLCSLLHEPLLSRNGPVPNVYRGSSNFSSHSLLYPLANMSTYRHENKNGDTHHKSQNLPPPSSAYWLCLALDFRTEVQKLVGQNLVYQFKKTKQNAQTLINFNYLLYFLRWRGWHIVNIETYSVASKEHRPVISWSTLLCMVTYKGAYGIRLPSRCY